MDSTIDLIRVENNSAKVIELELAFLTQYSAKSYEGLMTNSLQKWLI